MRMRIPSEPKLLGRTDSSLAESTKKPTPAFDIHKSNITSYAFLDEGKKVRLYIDLKGVGDACNGTAANSGGDDSGGANGDRVKAQVKLDWSETSMCLLVTDYPKEGEERCLSFGRLHGKIEKGMVKTKQDRLVVTLFKTAAADTSAANTTDGAEAGEGEAEAEPAEREYEEWPAIAARGESVLV